jgi:hypothetical protein
MLRKIVITLLALTLPALVFAQAANPPPAHGIYGAGWGMNPTNWNAVSGSFSAWGLYDPLYVGGGDAWVVSWDPSIEYIQYAPITLELWVEMYALQTYRYLSYQWHRLGNQEECIEFLIEGTVQSNHPQAVSLKETTTPLTHLFFIEDIFGRTTPGNLAPNHPNPNADIPLLWYGRWGRGLDYGVNQVWPANYEWQELCVPGCLTMLITEPCDHWFQYKGEFCIPYHQPDGYYLLEMAGCPAPIL